MIVPFLYINGRWELPNYWHNKYWQKLDFPIGERFCYPA